MAVDGVQVVGSVEGRRSEILSDAALAFLAALHRQFEPGRREVLAARADRQAQLRAGERPGFLDETRAVREGDWQVTPPPAGLRDRRVEITGPTDRKMVINALNCGARGFMADFEDANSPTWANMIDGQVNLYDASRRTIELTEGDRHYRLNDEIATVLVRPRGWHLVERHLQVDGEPISGSLFDFGLYVFHNARALLERGSGPFYYVAKLEGHREARLWAQTFAFAEDHLGLERGTIRATVLIETVLAAFEMDEILYEMREHSAGLNAGRWDYIFSIIKKLGDDRAFLLPNRSQVTMTAPFMSAYARLLAATCHRRGAHAIGGMSAFIPNRRDPEVTERAFDRVREDKRREASQGFDGTWVAHPDLVPIAKDVFDGVLGDRANQVEVRPDVSVAGADLLTVSIEGAAFTEAELRNNVQVGIWYAAAWLAGSGAVAIHNLMEDAATAEISRSQIWQWIRHGVVLDTETRVTADLVRTVAAEECEALRSVVAPAVAEHLDRARALFEQSALTEEFVEFLTLPAYEALT
ncbi:MAG: malate synthase A [Chloroflexi bacterium]|nr:malate synthase A [Chloroflexota bacterium]MDA1239311.1 malate synthase A [Chloroflexota bacterium]